MDFFYIPWISSPKSEDDFSDKSEIALCPVPSPQGIKPKYKLTFFNSKGLAEISRLIFVFVGEPFIDDRISYEYWKTRSHEFAFQQLPILQFDGHVICHAVAIARFIGRQYGLAGKNPVEEAEVDGIMDVLMTLINAFRPFVLEYVKKNHPTVDISKFSDGSTTKSPSMVINHYFPILENAASKFTLHGFLFPGGLTFADFGVAVCFEIIENLYPEIVAPYQRLKALTQRIHSLPQLQSYLRMRPISEF